MVVLFLLSCQPENSNESVVTKGEEFNKYWNSGLAEISSYDLQQVRYGEIHPGEAVLIFVKEPFSKSKQVKLDDWKSAGDDKLDVLKLNSVRKFYTGIYPYSTMTSVFSSLNTGRMVKITCSVQEWCGQAFMQFNAVGEKLNYLLRSYFESEGDKNETLERVFTEDELWNLIKIRPQSLPQGRHAIIPSAIYLRFSHQNTRASNAELHLQLVQVPEMSKDSVSLYTIKYDQADNRSLKVFFEKDFPHQILGWEETYQNIGTGSEGKDLLTTRATLKKSIRIDYWNKNKLEHTHLRDLLN